ncbi:hypothetical protein [uncultured Zoogloea sp.]|uniref:hypothetical protein n=1 Tax=uncultured Zoogloea sp. TaxID=160237 RepID=UPI00262C911D|nr:hypothetical protein [uncultured Zoogloea sp.]
MGLLGGEPGLGEGVGLAEGAEAGGDEVGEGLPDGGDFGVGEAVGEVDVGEPASAVAGNPAVVGEEVVVL